jgi:hypothetical protein
MLLPVISSLSKGFSNSACFHAGARKFGWMLVHVVLDMHDRFQRQILVRRWITVLHVMNLQNHAFAHYFFSFKNCFLLGLIFTHAIKFRLMLYHGVFSVHAKFHRQILVQGQITYYRWGICRTMLLPVISSLSKIVSNLACFHAHAIKFWCMLDHVVADMHTKFHRQLLLRGWRRNIKPDFCMCPPPRSW